MARPQRAASLLARFVPKETRTDNDDERGRAWRDHREEEDGSAPPVPLLSRTAQAVVEEELSLVLSDTAAIYLRRGDEATASLLFARSRRHHRRKRDRDATKTMVVSNSSSTGMHSVDSGGVRVSDVVADREQQQELIALGLVDRIRSAGGSGRGEGGGGVVHQLRQSTRLARKVGEGGRTGLVDFYG